MKIGKINKNRDKQTPLLLLLLFFFTVNLEKIIWLVFHLHVENLDKKLVGGRTEFLGKILENCMIWHRMNLFVCIFSPYLSLNIEILHLHSSSNMSSLRVQDGVIA